MTLPQKGGGYRTNLRPFAWSSIRSWTSLKTTNPGPFEAVPNKTQGIVAFSLHQLPWHPDGHTLKPTLPAGGPSSTTSSLAHHR